MVLRGYFRFQSLFYFIYGITHEPMYFQENLRQLHAQLARPVLIARLLLWLSGRPQAPRAPR